MSEFELAEKLTKDLEKQKEVEILLKKLGTKFIIKDGRAPDLEVFLELAKVYEKVSAKMFELLKKSDDGDVASLLGEKFAKREAEFNKETEKLAVGMVNESKILMRIYNLIR